ncbi:uncharacterized protein LOC131011142 isoform X2 [Salvia miltiorrhiza]|uniref:uncharacterized protein LOC131011142 isoform X2 n=1 Tax=Salvia miltiorrhiza TaxID=226208 RepID=UPI0025AD00A0|nr:uncharacterized protein LOC131011142 isoform X2 [Salvia miltiorrhiza]XP_057794908.1 uncharacterized protein LOC131011142 isoform X2 [Salvia miltiorrhiza]XP_057794909.1 uncharacterized protein LOC131011142 isoform X2 [Salvia miltiorrhiza]XP_057794910.1 uncharacterized protein LOC131011142 isoform X2 [Salvia miltiorrhiza]
MLLAVEGGGFFSSSASGYSKGLTLLLLGQKNEGELMRVAPWSQYQLVDQETDPYPDLQLAPGKNRLVRGCASFVCFGRAAAGHENSSPLKVGPTQNQEVLPEPVDIDESKDQVHSIDPVDYNENIRTIVSLKSSLKKSANISPVARAVDSGNSNKHEVDRDVAGQLERRKVQWTDTTGGELFEIREFEMRCSSRKQGCTLRLIWYLLSLKMDRTMNLIMGLQRVAHAE